MLKKKKDQNGQPANRRDGNADPLTGLPARGNLLPWVTVLADKSSATSERMALLFLALRHIDDVNDTFGPDRGDALMREVAQRLSGSLGERQRICRYSGAEFAITTEGVATVERAHELGDAVFEILGEPFEVGSSRITVGGSVGIALSDAGYPDAQAWLDDAHHALAEARDRGNRTIVIHDESTRNRINVQITEERVQRAFERSEFVIVYQPIVTPQDGNLVGFEALLRWLDPSSGGSYITPGQFLPLLEKTGLITPVGTWALQEASERLKLWNDMRPGEAPLFISVNLGAKQLAQPEFPASVAKALDACGLPPEQLVLDVTPAAIRYNKTATWAALRDLKYLGVRLALDDFGVGESSMSYLRELQVDIIRVDRQFVEGVGQVPEDTAIVKHMIEIGRDLGIQTLAEGVETEDQANAIRGFDCPLAQGWFWGRGENAATTEEELIKTDG